jgi:hypothetical protein
VMTNRAGVLETIAAAVREAQAPSLPSPASGGGGARGSSEPALPSGDTQGQSRL